VLKYSYHPSDGLAVVGTIGTMRGIAGGGQISISTPILIASYFFLTATAYAPAASSFGTASQQVIQSSARVIAIDRIFSGGF